MYSCLFWLCGAPLSAFAQTGAITITFDPPGAQCIDDTGNCTATVAYGFQVGADCPFGSLQVAAFLNIFNDGNLLPVTNALSGSYPNYSLSGSYPLGQHSFEVVVDDGCGNAQTAVLPFEVVDCEVSPPVCVLGTAVEISPVDTDGDGVVDDPQAYLYYNDFLMEPLADCTLPLDYSIQIEGEAADFEQDSLLLQCEQVGTLVLELHVQDGAGNRSSCLTFVLVQDNYGCPDIGLPFISGVVETEYGDPVEQVTVSIAGQSNNSYITQSDGTFVFYNPVPGLDYTLTPALNEAPLNGVSTLDMILISRHILGIQPLDSPYKRIAADTNGSGHITALDLIQLRRMILGIENGFDNADSWRFVDAAYAFPNPADPWAEEFPEVIHINDFSIAGLLNRDFIAIKIGDVNGDAETD